MEDDNNEKVSQEELDELDIIAKKEKEREIQRKEILNNAVSGKVANVRDRIVLYEVKFVPYEVNLRLSLSVRSSLIYC